MRRALAALLCAILGLSAAQAQQRPGYAPNFRSGFQFIGGLPTYDFANGSYPPVTVSRASSGDLAADAAGNYAAFAANALRRTNVGATIEGAQTNQIRNSAAQGGTAGTPGTLPPNWAWIAGSAPTNYSINFGVEKGMEYIEVAIAAGQAGTFYLRPEGPTVVAAANGQLWSASAFLRATSGNVSGFATVSARDTNGNNLGGVNAPATVLTVSYIRSVASFTNTSASTAFEAVSIGITTDSSASTIRITFPQLERRDNYVVPVAGASTPIRTTGTAATRAADAVSFPAPAGASKILYTFDDGSTQQVSVSPGAYTIPTNLNRPVIARAQVLP